MLLSQFGMEQPARVPVWVRLTVIIFMIVLFLFVIPTLVAIMFNTGLIPSTGLTDIFYIVIFPIIGIIAIVYVIWKA